MKIVGINQERCIGCEECIAECGLQLYLNDGEKVMFNDPNNMCILCGHCLAVCPEEAIIAEGIEEICEFEEAKNPSKILDYENIMKLFRARRSIRRFQEKKIPREEIEGILQAMRYAPSGSNRQSWNYIVITDPKKIKFFSDKVMKMLYLLRKVVKLKSLLRFFVSGGTKELLLNPNTPRQLDRIINKYEAGGDPIFHNAPCVIVLHSPDYANLAGCDAGIALTHGMFAAQSLGIGSCWIGFAQETVLRNKKLRKWLQIPKGRKCHGVVVFGYPEVKFHRAPPRNPLEVQWID